MAAPLTVKPLAAVECGGVEAGRENSSDRRSRKFTCGGGQTVVGRIAASTMSPSPSPLMSPAPATVLPKEVKSRGPGATKPLEPFSDARSRTPGKMLPKVESRPKTKRREARLASVGSDDQIVYVITVDVACLLDPEKRAPKRGVTSDPVEMNPRVPSRAASSMRPSCEPSARSSTARWSAPP